MDAIKQIPRELAKYIPSVIPLAAIPFLPDVPPEVLTIFGTSIQNCIEIIYKSSEYRNQEIDLQDINVDWRANFFDKCRIVHDDEMQILWAKILAGEANKHGTYSKRTVNFVAEMDKREAELFTHFCGFICEIKYDNKKDLMPLLLDVEDFLFKMSKEELNHLDSIGLIRLNDFPIDITLDKPIEVSYYDENIRLGIYRENIHLLPTSEIELTQIGEELYPISGCKKVDGLFEHICNEMWVEFIES